MKHAVGRACRCGRISIQCQRMIMKRVAADEQQPFSRYLSIPNRIGQPTSGHGTTRKPLAARIDSANWGEADRNAAAR